MPNLNYTSGPVCLDEWVTVLAEYPTDVRWNGFLVPHLDPWSVEFVLAASYAMDAIEGVEGHRRHEWHDEDGILRVTEVHDGEDYVEDLFPNADGLYPLGAYAWVWAVDEERTEAYAFTMDPDAFDWVADVTDHFGSYLDEGERFAVSVEGDEIETEFRVVILKGGVEEAWGRAATASDAARLAILARCPDLIVDPAFAHLAPEEV
jgi:hypothetical protein